MKITVWGCRGSIPTPGPATLKYGGNTTCLSIETHTGCLLVIDAGTGIRFLGKQLMRENRVSRICMMLTHSHWDHLMGFPFFTPAYSPQFDIDFCAGHPAQHTIRPYFETQMQPPFSPVDSSTMKARFHFDCIFPCGSPDVGVTIQSIVLNHPNGGLGFKFTEGSRSFVFLTDNELGFAHPGGLRLEDYQEYCRGTDLLMHDAQYTDEEIQLTRGWGHSTYGEAVDLAMAAGVKRLGLFHHDPDRGDRDLDQQVLWCRRRLAEAGSPVDCFAVAENSTFEL
jgi:phosphoribosyl 1,2-cyclic phosphodiesterase